MKTLKTSLFIISAFLFLANTQLSACSFTAAFKGPTMVCAGSSTNYVSKLTSGHYYRWIAFGGTVVSGAGTDSVWINWPIPGTGSLTLVDSTSACATSVTRTIQVGLSSAVLTAAGYSALGKATASGKKAILTDNNGNENSAAWNPYQIDLNKNFDLNFITNQNGSADGMMLVLQNTGLSAYSSAGQGSDMGYYSAASGVMDQSIGVEEDIYMSPSFYIDSSASHLNLVMDKSPTPLRKQINISPALGGGSNHKVRMTWNRDANLLEYYFDGTKEFSWANDIVKNVFKGNPNVWFGFTGATGGATSTQSVTTDTLIYNQAIINATSDTICSGDSAILTSSFGVSYAWSTGAKTKSIKVAKSGTYSVTVTDSFNCVSAASITKNIVTLTPVVASFTVASGCIGNNVPITNKTTPTKGVRYSWTFGDGGSATGTLPTYSYKSVGSYTISVSATNGGCTSKASNSITVYTHPSGMVVSKSLPFQGQFNAGDVVTPDNICQGDTNTYQFSAPVGYSNSDYGSKWVITSKTFATASGTISTDTVFKNPVSTKNAYFKFFPGNKFGDSVLILTMHVKLMPGNCDTVFTRYIQVRPKAVSNFLFANACQGFAVSFHDTSTIAAGDAISNWNWDFGDGTTSTLQDPKHTYSKPGSYKVTLTATSNANCGIPVAKTVNEYTKPSSAFHAGAGCVNSGFVFTDSSSISSGTIATHAWTFGDGATSSLKSPAHIYTKSGPYQVKLVVTSSFGCKDSITKPIRVEPTPKAAFIYRNACVGTPVIFTNKSTDTTIGSNGIMTYLWNFGNGNTSTAPSPPNTYKANGAYKVKLIATSKYGCIDSAVQKITPNPETVPNIVYSGACTKNAVAFGDSDKNDLGATYTWNFGDNSSFVTNNDTSFHTYTTGNTYKVQLILTNGAGCTDTGTASVLISDHPVASFTAADVCFGKVTAFSNTSTPATGLTYSWNFGDTASGKSNFADIENPLHIYRAADSFMVQLAATSAGGCTDSLTKTVHVIALPVVKWSYTVHNQKATFIPQDATQKAYEWYFGTGDSSSAKEPVYPYPAGAHKYQVRLVETNAEGCSDSYTDSVTVTGLGISVTGPQNNLNISIYPNPFEEKTTISYTLNGDSKVNVSVYDIEGRLISELRNGSFAAGKYQDQFDAVKCNAMDGVYIVKMTVNGEVYTGRIVEMK